MLWHLLQVIVTIENMIVFFCCLLAEGVIHLKGRIPLACTGGEVSSNNQIRNRTLKELTIKDNFMFAAVMLNPDNCSRLVEMVLHIPVDRVVVDVEKSIVYHPEYHGIRLDVYAKDENNTRYSIEMQVRTTPVEKRSVTTILRSIWIFS